MFLDMNFEPYIIAFISLFVAIDPIGLIPLFLGTTEGAETKELKIIAWQATLTSAIIAILFLLLGKIIFYFLRISVQDFQIAGGLILFILAAKDFLGLNHINTKAKSLGIVPLGTPLIAGPALITTLLILVDGVGFTPSLIALCLNLILVFLSFGFARLIARKTGNSILTAFSKIIALLLAAIAIHMIRLGMGVHFSV